MINNVLILGNNTRSFLSSVRSLGRYHLRVYIAECNREDVKKSVYVYKILDFGDFENNPESWCENFAEFIKNTEIKFILPVDDLSILKLQYYENSYGRLQALYLPNESSTKISDDKELSTNLAKKLHVPTADTQISSSLSDVRLAIERFSFPIVVKPHKSFSSEKQKQKDRVLIIENEQEYTCSENIICDYIKKYHTVIVQKFFDGIGMGVELLAFEGEILTVFQHMRIHEPQKGGGSSLRKSIKIDDRMYHDAERIVKELNYSGVMMIEFKYNLKTQEYIFVEINSRLWGSLPLAINAGIDFPVYLYQMYVEGQREFNRQYKEGIYQRNFEADIHWKLALLREKEFVRVTRETMKQIFRVGGGKARIYR
jgi:predicted ATP-grasp superfamily ATP-dependent carboligase